MGKKRNDELKLLYGGKKQERERRHAGKNKDLDLLYGESRGWFEEEESNPAPALRPRQALRDERLQIPSLERRPAARRTAQERDRRRRLERRKLLRRKRRIRRAVFLAAAAAVVLLAAVGIWKLAAFLKRDKAEDTAAVLRREEERLIEENTSKKPQITEDFLTPNEFSRPGEKLPEVTELFVHYTANAGTSAAQNRSYFENLGLTGETSASAHFVIGYDGEIIQCLPLDEIGYAVMEHNYNSISIECCYLDENGRFTDATRQSLIRLLGWLMQEYRLGPSDVKRHYDAAGKLCPLYYVEHEDAWEELKKELEAYISEA